MLIADISEPYTEQKTLPSLLKLKIVLQGENLAFSFVEVKENNTGKFGVDVKSVFTGGGAAFESADIIMQIPIEELTAEQVKVLREASPSLHPNGYFIDDKTGLVLGNQDEFGEIVKRAKAVDGKAQVLKEVGEYREMLQEFGYHFAQCMLNPCKDDN